MLWCDLTMTEATGRHVELYLRDETMGLAGRRQAEVREQVVELAETPAVDTAEIIEWPRKVAIEGPGPRDERAFTAFNAFSQWARDHDARLYPAFGTRACYAWDTGRRFTALVLPVMALAVYGHGELQAVYPHNDGETYYTVFDGLDALETGEHIPTTDDEPEAILAE